MLVSYTVKLTIINSITSNSVIFNKSFQNEITAVDDLLYDNYHILTSSVYVLELFQQEVQDYCITENISTNDVIVDEYEIATITENVEVFFENSINKNEFTLTPDIKCYVYPKEEPLPIPTLVGEAYDSTTIIWTWPKDMVYSHYLISEPVDFNSDNNTAKIIATLPIGTDHFIETGLSPNTPYSRRLVNYTDTQTSFHSAETTVTTETVNPKVSLDKYFIEREQDWTITDEEKEVVKENLKAFKSGIGDFNDLKVYKQMDNDFYEKFKTYITLTGKYSKREKRYDQVGFNYKVCLEALETIEEQEGEVTFKLDAYPWQECYKTEYLWAVKPVVIRAKVCATIDLFKKESQTIEKTIDVRHEVEEIVPATSKPTSIMIVLDLSSSMRYPYSNNQPTYERLNKMKNGAKVFIDEMNTVYQEDPDADIEWIIVGFATTAHKEVFTNAQEAKDCIDQMKCGSTSSGETGHGSMPGNTKLGNRTDWGAGLRAARGSKENKCMVFFTDGFPTSPTPVSESNMVSYIEKETASFHKANPNTVTYIIFGCQTSDTDPDMSPTTLSTSYKTAVRNSLRVELSSPKNAPKYKDFSIDNESAQAIANVFVEAKDLFTPETTRTSTETQPLTITYNTEGVDVKTIQLQSKEITFVIDGNNTPVTYDSFTKRAVIRKDNWLPETQMSSETLYELLKEAKENSPEWLSGYNANASIKDSSGNIIGDVYKNIYIIDTYSYSDEDAVFDIVDFNSNRYEYGMQGTINVYSQIPKVVTDDHTDDEYIALENENTYLMIKGYCDAIIYEGTRYGHSIVNSYSKPVETMFYKNDLYNVLRNRMNKNYRYSGPIDTNHVFKEELELKLPSENYLTILGDGINTDMRVTISKHYESPVLNYRFNIKDPDAYTPYYEILPTSNEYSEDKHVVIVTVYYANNVEVNSEQLNDNYYGLFDYKNPVQIPLKFIYGTKATWNYQTNTFDCDGRWITEYVHFFARKMKKTKAYYDELPRQGEDFMYGLVNGRYRNDNLSGKQDLIVESPKFNIPTTVLATHSDTIKIYIKITEFYPNDSLVTYKWDNEYPVGSGFTKVNGDYVRFSCDSLTYKDVEYENILGTYEMKELELFDTKPKTELFNLTKPKSNENIKYDNYYLNIVTDNNDVLPVRYPTEVNFTNDNSAVIPIEFLGIINSTSKWSPRIHNGYYYINQHEKHLYSEFDVEADFDTTDNVVYENANAFVSFEVEILKDGGQIENYDILKETMAEMLQNENKFLWVQQGTSNKYGITLKPAIQGWSYKHYQTQEWISPVILFDNPLTTAGPLTLDYLNIDGTNKGLDLFVRSYDLENGQWTDWVEFQNGTIPNVILSVAYQVKTALSASEVHTEYLWDDYLCSYLDWEEYIDMNLSENIATITDHMTTGIFNTEGIAISKVLDYSCNTGIALQKYASSSRVELLVGFSNNINDLVLENIKWQPATTASLNLGYKYYRFKVVIPFKEKLYWIHLKVKTLKTEAELPYIKSINMTGTYSPEDITGGFVVLEQFDIPKDGLYHQVVPRIGDYISSNVIDRGFEISNITSIKINGTNPEVYLLFDDNILLPNPDPLLLETSIEAASTEYTIKTTTKLPYIFSKNNKIVIKGTPQQYCPVSVEDIRGVPFTQIFDVNPFDMKLSEIHIIKKSINYIELKRNDYELDSIKIWVNDDEIPNTSYNIINHLIFFKESLIVDDIVTISYNKENSFYVDINRRKNTTTITVYTNILTNDLPTYTTIDEETGAVVTHEKKFKVMFETNKYNNKLKASHLSLNPVYRTEYSGFIYLTEEVNTPHKIKIWCNPSRVKAGGVNSVDIQIEVLDINSNPVIGRDITLDCQNGTIKANSYETDVNGIVHVMYFSSYFPANDIITAKILEEDDVVSIQETIKILSY